MLVLMCFSSFFQNGLFPSIEWTSVEAGERIEQLRDAAVRTRGAGVCYGHLTG